MSMQPDIREGYASWDCATCGASTFLPTDVDSFDVAREGEADRMRDYMSCGCSGATVDPDTVEEHPEGIIGRLSMPGYMDCTEWCPYSSEAEALERLTEDDLAEDEDEEDDLERLADSWTNGNRKDVVQELVERARAPGDDLSGLELFGRFAGMLEREPDFDQWDIGVFFRLLQGFNTWKDQ